jgi:type IV secretion system protein VirD4
MAERAPAGRADAGVAPLAIGATAVLALWCGAAASTRLGGAGCRVPGPQSALAVALYAVAHRHAPVAAAPGCRPSAVVFWVVAGVTGALAAVAGVAVITRRRPAAPTRTPAMRSPRRQRARREWVAGRFRHRWFGRDAAPGAGTSPEAGAQWARRSDLAPLLVRAPERGRLVLGRWGRRLVAGEARQSVLVVGPTQTMKTSGLAVPAVLEWDGPVLATSVKTDLLRDTLAVRQRRGRVWVYDPARCTGMAGQGWSPLAAASSWPGARRAAAAMVGAARSAASGPTDADFWYATAGKLLAPLLFAAAVSGRTMADVVRWVDTQETGEVLDVLAAAGVEEALTAAEASFGREERARSSIFTTAETVIDPFADPDVAEGEAQAVIDPKPLLDGGAHTLYLCAPSHEQRRLRPLFSALVDQVVSAVYERAAVTGAPLDPPLLVVLDEAAQIAPLDDLDGLAATGAGQGIQLVTVWQDLAQVTARYGARSASVVNNHRAKLLLSGVSDPATLDQLSGLVGDSGTPLPSVTTDASGARSTTESVSFRRLAPTDALRRIAPGHALLVYGHLNPARIQLRPWFRDRALSHLVATSTGPGYPRR